MLIDRYHYDDHQLNSKVLFPEEWRNIGDDYHAARSLFMLMRYEDDRSLMIKFRMNLNRHWHDWQNMKFTWESSIWFIMVYKVLTGENIITAEHEQVLKDMWGFNRSKRSFNIPQEDGKVKVVESEEEGTAAAMIRNYWFGRYYGLIDPSSNCYMVSSECLCKMVGQTATIRKRMGKSCPRNRWPNLPMGQFDYWNFSEI